MSEINQQNKATVWHLWQTLDHTRLETLSEPITEAFHSDVKWHGPHPINEQYGTDNLINGYWEPLRRSFPDLTRTTDVFIGGESEGEDWVAGTGYFSGTFQNDWVDIPATGRKTYIRFGQFYVLAEGKITESYLILDVLDVMRQAGYQLVPPSKGAEGGRVPPPRANDGVMLLEQDDLESRRTLQLVLAMIGGMRRYDGKSLDSMNQGHYWHPQFRWFGPNGIGTSRSLTEYQEFHQGPWLVAFPDRGTSPGGPGRMMGFIAEGPYAAGGIWGKTYATHTGVFMGLEPTGKTYTIRDFDWWKREGDLLVENWVPIDIIDILMQLGVDLFARMRESEPISLSRK
ncbi:MAG: ester cyclase [Chloroflexota bacterium]